MENKVKVHPLEDVFDMQPEYFKQEVTNGQVIERPERDPFALSDETAASQQPIEKDEEDIKIDQDIDLIFDKAVDAFNEQMEFVQAVEPRYAARNAEVAAQYLNIALNSKMARAKVKSDRKRNNGFIPYSNGAKTVNNNVIVADRNDILKMILQDKEEKK